MAQNNETNTPPSPPDSRGMCIEILECEDLPDDPAAYMAAIERDGVADFHWFLANPRATQRVRPLSCRERKAYAVSGNAVMVVTRDEDVLSSTIFCR